MGEELGMLQDHGDIRGGSLARSSARPIRPGSRRRTWIIAIGALLLVILVLVGIKAAQIRSMINAGKTFAPPPESVSSAKVEATQWEASRSAVGTLVAVRAVTVASEVPGKVNRIGFESGAFVHRGDALVELDSSTEQAQLAAAKADAELAKATLERTRTLRSSDYSSAADLDAADARAKQTIATVAQLQATIAKKTIRAPFDGRVAIRQVELGQVLAPGTLVASLQSVHPIHADFWLPQQALTDLQPGMKVRLRTDVFPNQSWEGVVTTINPEVDVSSRNVRVRATFPNPDGRLRPGMFANVDVISPEKRSVVVIPSTAVIYAPYGDSVFALEKKEGTNEGALVARQKFVRLGERRGDLVAVVSGLTPGETVVSSGAFKLRNGAAVTIRNDLAPGAELAPKPADE
ncbi:MAG TPA: efflux RND transporter periplasmic adaptor subunit [Myxococcales bacterium]|nr:efflux RND transporter periplasmic adaptor subunit [Myxococcales bacterium]